MNDHLYALENGMEVETFEEICFGQNKRKLNSIEVQLLIGNFTRDRIRKVTDGLVLGTVYKMKLITITGN